MDGGKSATLRGTSIGAVASFRLWVSTFMDASGDWMKWTEG